MIGPLEAGAGTIWREDGLILTNAHVVQKRKPKVTLSNGRSYPAKLLAADNKLDLAVLSIEAKELPTIELGDSKALQVGQWVTAVTQSHLRLPLLHHMGIRQY